MTRPNVRLAPPARGTTVVPPTPIEAIVAAEELTTAPGVRSVPPLVPLHSAIMEFEHEYLLRALAFTNGSRSRAASLLGISRKTLWVKLKRRHRATEEATPTPGIVRP